MPIYLLLKVSAAIRDVPEPAKQSKTISSGFEEDWTMTFNISKFFSVG